MMVSHPPVLVEGASPSIRNSNLQVLARYGNCDDICLVPYDPSQCPMTQERFAEACNLMQGQVAVASGSHGAGHVMITGAHPEMSDGIENRNLVAEMLHACSICAKGTR